MIAWLSEWLKEIVMIVLLAVFVDLILPNRSMQRYVKVVLSLLILLAILSPLVELLRSGDQWADWLQAGADIDTGQLVGGAGGMPPLRTITQEAERMSAERSRQALELAQLRLEAAVVQALEEKLSIRQADVSATLRLGTSNAEVLLEQMNVRLWPRGEAEQAAAEAVPLIGGKPAVIQPIEPVAPVAVSIRDEPLANHPHAAQTPEMNESVRNTLDEAADASAIEDESWQQAALAIVEEQFAIPPDKVRISVEARR